MDIIIITTIIYVVVGIALAVYANAEEGEEGQPLTLGQLGLIIMFWPYCAWVSLEKERIEMWIQEACKRLLGR